MIVLLRPILVNVTAIVSQPPRQMPPGARGNNPGINGGPGGPRSPDMASQSPPNEEPEPSPEEIDAARTREITSKAMTAILLMLLKWLRISRELDMTDESWKLSPTNVSCSFSFCRRAQIRILDSIAARL